MLKPKRTEYIEGKISMAMDNLKAGYSCSEAVLLTYCPQFGLNQELAFKIASGFGGGMGMGETCGAVTAACMVIGLKYGAISVKDRYSRDLTYVSVADFTALFQKRNGSTYCRDLIGGIVFLPLKAESKFERKGTFLKLYQIQ